MKAIYRFLFICALVLICMIANAQDFKQSDIELKKGDSLHPKKEIVEDIKEETKKSDEEITKSEDNKLSPSKVIEIKPISTTKKGPLNINEIVPDFNHYLESLPFLSLSAIESETSSIDEHLKSLRNWKDKDAYIREHHLNTYINTTRDSLSQYTKNISSLITDYLDKFKKKGD